ncbi:MAG: regulatory protein RecX [Bryobacterales bacterium]|nr:regulatory protein RecX [Bryobacterales bacterium]
MDADRPAPLEPPTRADLLQRALKLLATRDYAELELRHRLSAHADSGSEVDGVLARLRELGFLDESRFAERKAVDAVSRRLVGKRRIASELEARELDPATIAQAVNAAYEGRDEAAMALAHLEKRLSSFLSDDKLEDPRALQRAYGKLRRAGFGHAASVTALRAHSRLAANLDEFTSGDE